MERFFTQLVDYQFTAELEDDLDAISRGEKDSLKYLSKFYYGNGHPGLDQLVRDGGEKIDPREVCGIALGTDKNGREIQVRIGRFGPFLTDGETRASLHDAMAPDEITLEKAVQFLEEAAKGPQSLGKDPESGREIYLKTGRFGTYVQLGEDSEAKEDLKRSSLLPGMTAEEVTLATALQLLSLPRSLGNHPENNQEIIAANGRYGPYIRCGDDTRSIPMDEMSPLDMTLEQAVELLSRPKTRGRGAIAKPKVLKEIGKHPTTEAMISLKSGRYGPYVTDGEVNATVPRGKDPEQVTLDEAVELLRARAERIASGGGGRRGRGTRKKSEKAKGGKKSTAKKGKKLPESAVETSV
jgi:DNA topoisomerase-1